MEKIQRKRGGLYMYNNFLHTLPAYSRERPRLSVCQADDLLFQSKGKVNAPGQPFLQT